MMVLLARELLLLKAVNTRKLGYSRLWWPKPAVPAVAVIDGNCDGGCAGEQPEGHSRGIDVGRLAVLVDKIQMARSQETIEIEWFLSGTLPGDNGD